MDRQVNWTLAALGDLDAAADYIERDSPHYTASLIMEILAVGPRSGGAGPQVVGIDDWAIWKGHTYATVIVDLERHRIVDVLPDRQADTVAQWLAQHPEIPDFLPTSA